jgi:hypothetical protein
MRCKYEGEMCGNEVDRKEKQGGAGKSGLREGQGFTVVILEKRCRDGGTEGKGAVMRGRRKRKMRCMGMRRCWYEVHVYRYEATQKREIECRCRGDLDKGRRGVCRMGKGNMVKVSRREKGCRYEGTKRRGKRCE